MTKSNPAFSASSRTVIAIRARTDRASSASKVDLPVGVFTDDVDLDPDARLHLQEREIVRQALGPRGGDALARAKWNGLERHRPWCVRRFRRTRSQEAASG